MSTYFSVRLVYGPAISKRDLPLFLEASKADGFPPAEIEGGGGSGTVPETVVLVPEGPEGAEGEMLFEDGYPGKNLPLDLDGYSMKVAADLTPRAERLEHALREAGVPYLRSRWWIVGRAS